MTTRTLTRPSSTTGAPRVIETVIWYPASVDTTTFQATIRHMGAVDAPVASGGPFPVVVFSHGLASSPVQSTFLTAHLASHGFVVAAPTHPGSAYDDCVGCHTEEQQRDLIRDGAINRPDDLSFTLTMLARFNTDVGSAFRGALDAEHAAAIGHSWGGYSAVMAAVIDPRFRAAVAMAPVVNDTVESTAQRLRAPVLVMGGRLDDITPFPAQEKLFFRLPSGTPRYLLTFPLGGHTAYSEVCPRTTPGCRPGELAGSAHALVNAYTVAFLRVFLLGDHRYAAMLNDSAGAPHVEFAALQ